MLGFPDKASGENRAFPNSKQEEDTIEKQILFNGRAWRNLHSRVIGDQFLFSNEFLTGSVSIADNTFQKVPVKYDILSDEIIALSDHGFVIQLNKEKVDSFSLIFRDMKYIFQKMGNDTVDGPGGYVNVLADGAVSLYVKYKKRILLLAVDNKYDLFNQFNRIYISKDNRYYLISSKKELLRILKDKEKQLKDFIRNNKLKVTRNIPDSFAPVVKFYNELQKQEVK
jgi:hypothetical protein